MASTSKRYEIHSERRLDTSARITASLAKQDA